MKALYVSKFMIIWDQKESKWLNLLTNIELFNLFKNNLLKLILEFSSEI